MTRVFFSFFVDFFFNFLTNAFQLKQKKSVIFLMILIFQAEEPQPSVMDNSKEQSGRRDTYKVMVQQAHSPCKSDSKGILYDLQNISVKQTSSPFSTTSSFNLSKGPKIFKVQLYFKFASHIYSH